MNTDNQLTAAATPLFLNKKEYRAAPLNDRDISELDEWVQTRLIQRASSALTPDMTGQQRAEILDSAMRVSQGLTWASGQGARILATVDGMAQLTWQMLKREHPTLTPEFVRQELMANPKANMEETQRVFNRLKEEEKSALVSGKSPDRKNKGKDKRKNRHRR